MCARVRVCACVCEYARAHVKTKGREDKSGKCLEGRFPSCRTNKIHLPVNTKPGRRRDFFQRETEATADVSANERHFSLLDAIFYVVDVVEKKKRKSVDENDGDDNDEIDDGKRRRQ